MGEAVVTGAFVSRKIESENTSVQIPAISNFTYTVNTLYGVTYYNGLFVAVGEAGTVVNSPDGENWGTRISGTPNWLNGITYGNNKFVSVGGFGTILTSSLGTTWHTEISPDSTLHLYGIAYNGTNTFVAVGVQGTIYTSSDGQNWSTITPVTTHVLQGITYAIR